MKPITDIPIKATVNPEQWAAIRQLKDDAGCKDMQELILTSMNALRYVLDNTEEGQVVACEEGNEEG